MSRRTRASSSIAARRSRLRSTRDALDAGIAIVMQETSLVPDLVGASRTSSCRSSAARAGSPMPPCARRGEELLAEPRPGRHPAARRRGARPLRRAAPARRDRQGARRRRQADHLRRADRLAQPERGRAAVRHHGPAARGRQRRSSSSRIASRRCSRSPTASPSCGRAARCSPSRADRVALTQADLIRHMVGQELGAIYRSAPRPRKATRDAPVRSRSRRLAAPPMVRDVSFAVREGEILGLGGLVGAGRSETVEAIFGLRPRSGRRRSASAASRSTPTKPSEAIRAGIGFVAEDRRAQNIVPDLSVQGEPAARPSRRPSRLRPRLPQRDRRGSTRC